MGFRRGKTRLRTAQKIQKYLPKADLLVLAFGQVDLELGYYYRRIIKGETITPQEFVDRLANIYEEFIDRLAFPPARIALKGVNLTVLADADFTFRYVNSIITEEVVDPAPDMVDALRNTLLDETAQNAMHLSFNHKIAELIAARGGHYFDINNGICARQRDGRPMLPMKLGQQFMPATFNHHISDSLYVRQLHYVRMLRSFGFKVAFMR